jgi:hypothetical protein
MVGKRAIAIVYGMSVDRAVGMSVGDEVAVISARVMKSKPEIIVAGVPGRRFRSRNTHTLERKGNRRRHHHDGGKPSKK